MDIMDSGKRKVETLEQVVSDKRLKRLEKNRESARECRRRKKEHLQEVQRDLERLENENLELRLQLKIGDEAEEIENAQVESIKDKLDGMVSQGVEEGEIQRIIKELKEQHADYGRNRTSAAAYHLDELARLLLPTTTTRACMYAILQDYDAREASAVAAAEAAAVAASSVPGAASNDGGDAAASSEAGINGAVPVGGSSAGAAADNCRGASQAELGPATAAEGAELATTTRLAGANAALALASQPEAPDGSAAAAGSGEGGAAGAAGATSVSRLWDMMAAELGVTPAAQDVLRSKAHIIKELEGELRQLMALIARLKGLVSNRSRSLDDEMAQIQSILTPTQTAKFVLWVSRNQACMHMLETLWSHVHDLN